MPESSNNPKRTRIERNEYTADILQGNNASEQFWYYVLQRKDSSEILDLAKYDTFAEAIEGAKQAVARMQRAAAV